MGRWQIYHKDGSKLTDANGKPIEIHSLEYSGEWMGACNVTADIENEAPIDFSIGDYIDYRGERFEINYDPGRIKNASRGMKGDGFKYSGVVFNGKVDELVRSEFLDIVLNDNGIHYTALPKFAFYVQSLDDLADRLQANMNDLYGADAWHFYTADKKKSVGDRHCDGTLWDEVYGEGAEPVAIESTSLSADNQSCWDMLSLVNSKFDANFIVRGRNVFIGTVGYMAGHIFKYGKGNGLYQIEEAADSSQAVITRMRGYGNTTNMPTRYYAEVGARAAAKVSKIFNLWPQYNSCELYLDMEYTENAYTDKREYKYREDSSTLSELKYYGYVVKVTFDNVTEVTGYITKITDTGQCRLNVALKEADVPDTGKEPSEASLKVFFSQIEEGKTIYITAGVKRSKLPSKNIEYTSDLPNNMAIDRLMLPGFPNMSLQQWWDNLTAKAEGGDESAKKRLAKLNPTGAKLRFSEDQYRPYVESANADELGVRPSSVYFDTDDEKEGLKDIYPTIEEMEIDGERIDEIDTGSEETVTDDGVYKDGQTVPHFNIWLKKEIDFDLHALANDDFQIHMKDGMCGGRDFNVAAVSKDKDGRWKLRLERAEDSDLKLYFPYKDFPIRKGDKFVLTGLDMPESYVSANSEELLRYTIAKLLDNCYTRKTYTPKVDEIFMARQDDEAKADTTGATKSLHDTLKEGDQMWVKDEDLGPLDKKVTIEKLSIKEQDGKIPTYEITLKEEKEVGTIQKIQNQISSIVSGSSVPGGYTNAQLAGMVSAVGKDLFLSKTANDTARGYIKFLKGIGVGDRYGVTQDGEATLESVAIGEKYGVDSQGDATLNDAKMREGTAERLHDPDSTEADRTVIGGQGFDLYMGDDKKSHLYVDYLTARVKAFFAQLEIRKVSYSGGTVVYSNAGSTISKVNYVFGADGETVVAYKCYCVADDGTTRTQNWWKPGMMALSQTFNVKEGTTENAANRRYWRLCVDAGQETLDDGRLYDWVLLSNVAQFIGGAQVIPQYASQVLGFGGTPLAWGDVGVAVQTASGTTSLAVVCGGGTDDDGKSVKLRTFWGYEEGSDVPLPGDVIVQAGDQIKWNTRGNVVVVRTSSEDSGDESAPSFAMYHGMGKPRDGGVWQWKDRTFYNSPELHDVEAERFSFHTADGKKTGTLASLQLAQDGFAVSVETLTKKDEEQQAAIEKAQGAADDAQAAADDAAQTADGAANDANSALKQISALTQTAEDITARVEATEGSLNTVTGQVDAVTTQVGELQVQAGGISMKVSQQEVRDRNLIPCSLARLGTDKYGAMFRPVRLVKGKRYALTVWGRIDSTLKARGGRLVAFVYRENASGAWTWSQRVEIDALELTRKVTKFTYTGDTADCHTAVYASPRKASGGGNVYVEKMQMEEIPEAQYADGEDVTDGTAWSLSAVDPAVQGSLVPPVGDGWTASPKTEITKDAFLADGYHVAVVHAKADAGATADVLAYNGITLEAGEAYTLSFWAKGTGGVHSYLYPGGCSYAVRDDGEVSTYEDGHFDNAMTLTADWKRRWVTFSVKTAGGLNLLPARLLAGGEAWVAGVKLEKGGRVTDYGAYAEELLATGIDIENRRITVTADQFRIRNNRGEETFEVDADGMVTMNNIAVGGVINRQGIEVTGDAAAEQLFDVESLASIGADWYAVPKLDLLYPIYYIKGSVDTYTLSFDLHMPSAYVDKDGATWGDVWDGSGKVDKDRLRKVRAMVGNVVTIYNDADDDNVVVKVTAMSDYFTDIWKEVKSQSADASEGVAVQAVSSSAGAGASSSVTAGGYGTLDNAWESGGLIYPIYKDDSKPMRSYWGKQRDELVYEVKRGAFISLRCVCEVNNLGRECVYWVANYGMGFDTK